MTNQEKKDFVGSFETFSITNDHAGLLGLGKEVQDEKWTIHFDREEGFVDTIDPVGSPRVVYNVGGLIRKFKRETDEYYSKNIEPRIKAL